MIVRSLALATGLFGAAGASQFPEYSQQYLQRLGGAVDELARVVQDFDADAAKLNLSRERALVDLAQGGQMGAARADTMVRTIDRHSRLSEDLAQLRGAGPFTRAKHAAKFTDGDLAAKVWADYKPAMPVTFEGAIFAGAGLLGGLALFSALIALIRLPFRRDQSSAEA